MPPQNSFSIKQNTPEAEKLERRVHAELKEIWDPLADATVAKYLTAMLTKGYDRKKIHSQLKAILQEPVTVQLLDWLYKHLRLHGSEYQSKANPASSKQAPKPPPSVTNVVPTEEVELRLEDLEAQQLEGSDLEDDDTAAAPTSVAEDSAGPSNRIDAVQPQQRDRRGIGQDGFSEPAGQAAQVTHAGENTGVGAQVPEKLERSERRYREPIPIPNFPERPEGPRSRASRATPDTILSRGQVPAAQSVVAAGANSHTAAAPGNPSHTTEKQLPKRQVEERQQEPPVAAGERRRLKSSVVLDWESWHKQKQPADEQRAAKSSTQPGKLAAPERAPIMPHSNSGTADQPSLLPTSQREREDVRENERDRERDREGERGAGAGRRRHEAEAERPGSRHREGDGDVSALRGHERESDGGLQKGGAPAHRSRSRSRSPRGRRPGRAPLVTANLLRSALGGLGGSGARGSKASVFERLGASGAVADAAPASVPARVSALQRLAGSDKADKAMDTSGSGRKRGPEGEADADAAILGSPPKTARGTTAQKPGASLRSAAAPTGVEPSPAPVIRAGPASGRQRLEAPATAPVSVAKQPAGAQKQGANADTSAGDRGTSEKGLSNKQPAAAAVPVASNAAPLDAQAAELEALRKQMAAMQEKLAQMEAARELSPPLQPQLQPQSQLQVQPQPQPQAQVQQHSQPQRQQLLQQQPVQLQPQPAPNLRLEPQQQQQSLVRPQSLPASQPEPGIAQQQQGMQPQQISMAARLQPQRVPVSSAATVGVRPAVGVSLAGGSKGPGAGGAGAATIMPTSMSDVIIEGGSGSPPRMQQPELSPKLDPQRLTAAQLDADLRSVVVTNVHFLASREVLAAHFSVVGPVKNVTIMRDKATGRPTAMAVVEMATEQATQAASALSGSLLMDLPIVVTLKAALLLQGINLAGMGMDPAGVRAPLLMPPVVSGAANAPPPMRLNPGAAPFVPGLPASASAPVDARLARGAVGGASLRPPLGASGSAGRQPWSKLGAGGRGRGSNVWVREAAQPGNVAGPSAVERS